MSLFARRPLGLGCAAFILSLILSRQFAPLPMQVLIALGGALFIMALLLCFFKPRLSCSLFLLLIAVGVLAGSLRVLPVYLHERPIKEAEGRTVTVSFLVGETLYTGASGSEFLVSLQEIDGKAVKGNAVLVMEEAAPFLSGDEVTCTTTAENLRYDNYMENRYLQYRANRAAVKLYPTAPDTVEVAAGEQENPHNILARLRVGATGRLRQNIRGDAGALAAAMLLGERGALSDAVAGNFRYAGVSHLLALSGLHLGILAILAERLLYSAGLSRKWRIAALLLFMLGYLFLTGFPLSLCRAALMFLCLQLAFLSRTRADALTSLLAAGTVLLLVSPDAYLSTSFQLTMLATLGILTVGTLSRVLFKGISRKRGVGWRVLLWFLSSLLLTLAASLFTYPIQWFTFGEVSLMTPLSNLLLILPATVFLYLATLTLFLFPAGFFGELATFVGNLMIWISKALGHPDVMLSLRGRFVPYLVFAALVPTVILLCVRLRCKLLVLLPHAVCTVIFFAILLTRGAVLNGKVMVLYGNEEKGTCILLRDGGKTLLADLGEVNNATLNLGVELLQGADDAALDYYLVPDAAALNENRIAAIARHFSPRVLLIPTPESEERLAALSGIAEAYGISLSVYEYGVPLQMLKYAEITVGVTEGDVSLQINGQNEGLLYQSGALIAPADVRYHIAFAGDGAVQGEVALGGKGTTVIVADEEMLAALLTEQNTNYILFPARHRFLLH